MLIILSAGLIVGFVVLAIVAFFFLFNDESKGDHQKQVTSSQNDFENISR